MIVFWFLVACHFLVPAEEGTAAEALAEEDCQAIEWPELKVPCLVSQGAKAAIAGDVNAAIAACAQIEDPLWQEECHFRMAEELGRAGALEDAVLRCMAAGRFRRFCLTHLAWQMPPASYAPDAPDALELLLQEDASLQGPTDALPSEIKELLQSGLRAGLWFRLFYGSGVADPKLVKSAPPEHRAAAMSGYGAEVVRLLLDGSNEVNDLPQRVGSIWTENEVIRGESLPHLSRVGRYHSGVVPPEMGEVQAYPTFGGGVRLVAADLEEDLILALLHGLHLREAVSADVFLKWLSDPRSSVRHMAAWVHVISSAPEPPSLLLGEHDDPVIQALARGGRPLPAKGGPDRRP